MEENCFSLFLFSIRPRLNDIESQKPINLSQTLRISTEITLGSWSSPTYIIYSCAVQSLPLDGKKISIDCSTLVSISDYR